jgi:IPT/TIG domain
MPSLLRLVAVAPLVILAGCSNALNPFCGSARPAPLIGSLSPSTVTFAEVQQGVLLKVNGNNFVSASEIVINGKALGATIISNQQLQIMLTTGVISGPGQVNVKVMTPSGNVGDVGCSSGGASSALVLTVQ